MEASRIVKIVDDTVISMELPKERQKFIFFMASGKFFNVKPCSPTRASGLDQAFTYKNYGTGQAEALILFIVCAVVGVLQVHIGKKAEVSA